MLNRGFAETMALKRSAGLETVACWQTDAQWIDREVRDQLDALFAHRVYFATASARDARAAVELTMAEFSDTVRPGIGHLSALGHPDVRLHLPKHHAIVSWTTPEGRQPPFIAQTIPLRVDQERLALHAARQPERGGRHRTDLRQPHWDRQAAGGQGRRRRHAWRRSRRRVAGGARPRVRHDRGRGPSLPGDSVGQLSRAGRARRRAQRALGQARGVAPCARARSAGPRDAGARRRPAARAHQPDPPPLQSERAATTTQRRLKRLSDAGLVERFQFHRRDGGGVPMCYVMTAAGLELLHANDGLRAPRRRTSRRRPGPLAAASPRGESDRLLRQARHDVHVAGWALALERALDAAPLGLRGPGESVLSPPPRRSSETGGWRSGPAICACRAGAPHRFPAHRRDGREGRGGAL